MSTAAHPHVVVGVDGSRASRAALGWAARQAQLTGASLHVVHLFRLESVGAPFVPEYALVADGVVSTRINEAESTWQEERDRRCREHAEALVRDMLAELYPGSSTAPCVTTDVRPSVHTAEDLISAAKDAEALVVGSRGLGGFRGLLLGSVSQQCVQHATCPVVVVRGDAGAGV